MNTNSGLPRQGISRSALLPVIMLAWVWTLFSCGTTGKAAFEPPNYTKDDVRRAEIKRIEEDAKTSPVRSLWRAWLFKDAVSPEDSLASQDASISEQAAKLFSAMVETVNAECRKAIEDKKYYQALTYLTALDAVSGENSAGSTPAHIRSLLEFSLKGEETVAPPVSESIRGTVTVWLDLGLKVERGRGYANSALGSGFFIHRDGYIITNYHVIRSEVDPAYEGFSRLFVKLAGDTDTKIPAKVVGWDPLLDLALLKVEVTAPYVFALGSSLGLEVGDRVRAIGSPVGLESTLTSGIVSALARKLFSVASVMQIDAAVNSGNSGGPLIDEKGNVQAIVYAGLPQFQGLNFAIPVEYLLLDVPGLNAGGKLDHGWLGGYGRTWIDSIEGTSGVAVQYVMPGGGLSYAGIEAGDTITSFNGIPVKRLDDLQTEILKTPSGTIAVIQGRKPHGEAFSRPVYLDARPEEPVRDCYKADVAAKYFVPAFGMELTPTSASNKRQYSVKSLIKGSIADEAGFSENDPVEVLRVRILESKGDESSVSYLFAELYTKKRKNGYLNVSIGIPAALDNPYFF